MVPSSAKTCPCSCWIAPEVVCAASHAVAAIAATATSADTAIQRISRLRRIGRPAVSL